MTGGGPEKIVIPDLMIVLFQRFFLIFALLVVCGCLDHRFSEVYQGALLHRLLIIFPMNYSGKLVRPRQVLLTSHLKYVIYPQDANVILALS